MTETKFIQCECQGEGMGIDYDQEDGLYYFSYWSQGLSNKRLGMRDKIRYCWRVLTKGKAFEDEIVFSSEKAKELSSWIDATEANKLPNNHAE